MSSTGLSNRSQPIGPTAEQYTELAELAGRLVHEIKNHLGSLSLNLQLLAEELDNPETPRERRALQRIVKLQSDCTRLSDLSTDFLRFARIGAIAAEPTLLKPLLEEMVDFVTPHAQEKGIEIRTFLSDLPMVNADRDLLQQAILNVLLNAIQAMPEGGVLTVQSECGSSEVRLSFIDTGIGMSAETLRQVFKPFYSGRAGGTGLGLTTTRKILLAHGGEIHMQSEPGRGTKVTFLLPYAST
jgi:signal transduction histidine kinase